MNGVPAGRVSPLSLWYVMPCTVYVLGHSTGVFGLSTPPLNRAALVITFIVEPGATSAVSAKSLKPALLAIARMWPVDGWITTIALFLCIATAERAAFSACSVIVVFRLCTFCVGMTTAWLLATGLFFAVWIST